MFMECIFYSGLCVYVLAALKLQSFFFFFFWFMLLIYFGHNLLLVISAANIFFHGVFETEVLIFNIIKATSLAL